MKMKKILRILVTFLLITTYSCSDFIEEDIRSFNDADQYYRTAEGFESLINVNFSQLREIYGNDPWLFEAGTDLYAQGRNVEPPGLSQYTQLNSSSTGVEMLYNACYNAILKANTGLYYSTLTQQTSTIPVRKGELKFLRANAYFLLVQTYGGVGLVTDYSPTAVLQFDRSSAETIYTFIVKELEESLALISANTGSRINKRAVQHLLAKVHLTRAYETFAAPTDFATAASYADAAIAGNGLTLSYSALWTPGNEANSEVLFAVQYDATSVTADPQNLGNKQANFFSSYLGGPGLGAPYRTYTLCPTAFAIGLFEQNDTRWAATFMTEVYTRYNDFYESPTLTAANVRHFYEPKWFTLADRAAYKASHPGVLSPSTNYHNYGTYRAAIGLNSDYQTIPVKKFDDPKAPYASGNNSRVSRRDFIVSRLAETYLIAAEAYLNTNPTTGLARLNVVRARAGVPNATLAEFNIDYILDERARELLGEYHRWFDLKRTGKLVQRASLYNYLIQTTNFNGSGGNLKILRPIPQEALDLNRNKSYPQNPAYL
jgi:starch-binding outer membrane protein, SusD/RagB family